MNALINHQIIEKNGQPLFVLVPYEEYLSLIEPDMTVTIPHDVVERHVLEGLSLIRAWREYKGLSQQEVAEKLGISQSAYSQMEKPDANLRKSTLAKLATALDLLPEQLVV
ncbi:MAG: helix-turn-helix domain-containing protein [Anaerolineales bacterium]|nr:helix-turn-helix domain-containing protein [Anaerolineales bacterium]